MAKSFCFAIVRGKKFKISDISVLKKLVFVHEEKKLKFWLICSFSPRGRGLKV